MASDKLEARLDEETQERVERLKVKYGTTSAMVRAAIRALDAAEDKTTEEKPTYLPPLDPALPSMSTAGMSPAGAAYHQKRLQPFTYPNQKAVSLWEQLLLPVGDVINSTNGPWPRLWPVRRDHKAEIERLFEPWRKVGFVAVWGEPETSVCLCPSTRMQAYFPGDCKVWCEFPGEDVDKAIHYLRDHPEVILQFRPDLDRFNNEEAYQNLFNLYHRYYCHYFKTGKPYSDD